MLMNGKEILREALEQLAKRIKNEVLVRLHSSIGINKKTGKNTLIGSNLEKSIDVKLTGEDELTFQIAGHYIYVVGGRKVGWGQNRTGGFVEGVKRWIREKGIRFQGCTENQTLFLVLRSIVNKGIAARPFIGNGYYDSDPSKVLPFLDEFFDNWADNIFEKICYELDSFFNS